MSFAAAKFENVNVDFSGRCNFGQGKLDFSGFKLLDGSLYFNNATMGIGTVDFSGANFKQQPEYKNESLLELSQPSPLRLDFTGVDFGAGELDFSNLTCLNVDVVFDGIECEQGEITFADSELVNYQTRFVGAGFGNGRVKRGDGV